MQEQRERADYDMRPAASKLNATAYIGNAKEMIKRMDNVSAKDRTALAVYLIMPERDKQGH
jgi:cytochrome c oxidase assembly protein Cox11